MSDEYGFKLSKEFMRRASPKFSDTALDTPNMAIRRPPVPERKRSDYTATHMAGYLDGLESRLARHLERQAPLWHRKEMIDTLNKWNGMANNHPAPQGAAPRNLMREASEYAAKNVEARIACRFNPTESVKMRFGLYDDSLLGMTQRANRRANIRDKMRIS